MDDSTEHDDLVEQLNSIRVEKGETTMSFQRTMEVTNIIERNLLIRIRARQTHLQLSNDDILNNRPNHLQVGDTVRITNCYNDNYGTVGVITQIHGRMVDIKKFDTEETHTRAWWNIERVI